MPNKSIFVTDLQSIPLPNNKNNATHQTPAHLSTSNHHSHPPYTQKSISPRFIALHPRCNPIAAVSIAVTMKLRARTRVEHSKARSHVYLLLLLPAYTRAATNFENVRATKYGKKVYPRRDAPPRLAFERENFRAPWWPPPCGGISWER